MPQEILVSPLGRAPGAVSGVVFALQAQQNIEIDKVITVSTSHPDVKRAAKRYLTPLFAYCDVEYDPIHVPAKELRGGSKSINPYVAMLGVALERAQPALGHVHVAVTGGRSGMGALAALATNLYGADRLWHLWVHQDIEEQGTVDHLMGLTAPQEMFEAPVLNPTKQPDGCEIVDLPFMDLRPLHPLLWEYHRTGAFPDPNSPLTQLLTSAGIQRFTEIFPAGLTFEKADQIMEMKTRYAEAEPREQMNIATELGELLQEAGVVSQRERKAMVDLVIGDLAPEALLDWAQDAEDKLGFWAWLRENKDSIGVLLSAGGFLLEALSIYLSTRGY
jgi:hypothetical protein